MIFSHKSDKAERERVQAKDRDWVIQLWDYTGSDFSWKERETNRFHSHQWVWLLPPVFLNALKYPYSLHRSVCRSLFPSFSLPFTLTFFSLCLLFFLNDLSTLSCISDKIDMVFTLSRRIRSDSISWAPGRFHKSSQVGVSCIDKLVCLRCKCVNINTEEIQNNIFSASSRSSQSHNLSFDKKNK